MFTMKLVRAVATALGFYVSFVGGDANAGIVSATNGTITIQSGNRTGLQQAFAWSNRCRAVPVSFSGHASAGRLLRVGGRFRIGSGRCAGRAVRGFTVVYRAPRNFKGTATVRYTLKAANVRNAYSFTRQMIVR
jgi:hypothetical protein